MGSRLWVRDRPELGHGLELVMMVFVLLFLVIRRLDVPSKPAYARICGGRHLKRNSCGSGLAVLGGVAFRRTLHDAALLNGVWPWCFVASQERARDPVTCDHLSP